MQISDKSLRSGASAWLILLVVAVLLRAGTLGEFDLTDKTEARYSEIARVMLVTGDWITPRLNPETPFWGKPPLSFWLTAASFSLFGVNDVSARLPSFLLLLAACWLVFMLGRFWGGMYEGIIAASIFITSGVVFISAGMVMTDPALVFSVTLAMTAFWLSMADAGRIWGYLFFTGIAIGLLAKGPLILVLVLGPLVVWAFLQRSWSKIAVKLPWVSGTILFLGLSLPWYLLAENATPGFLEYFLIGEHIYRFIDSGWQGDLYGGAHSHPRGMVWIYFLLAGLPWSFPALKQATKWLTKSTTLFVSDGWKVFLLAWALVPMIFFSLTSNILPTYILPSFPAIALILSDRYRFQLERKIYKAGWIMLIVTITLGILFSVQINGRSQKQIIQDSESIISDKHLITYLHSRPYSASFYSDGQAGLLTTQDEITSSLEGNNELLYVIKRNNLAMTGTTILVQLELLKEYPRWLLYRKKRQLSATD